ncbi:isochorismatase family protein [Lentzea sp. NEAU-D13]|uniref:Isochorismatase family protein n=1 Tax=Lentzea alba TaxID=2714351 RepID=A0A7C9VNS8_9PSEU|nr:isochorismatase family protein [Lentzea alba]NGY60133.1 isochorismatase family protein [Lentzea alba]
MKPALVIVDVQEVLIPFIWRGAELADLIADLADRARAHGVPVVALQQVGGAMFAPEAPGTRLSARLRLQPQDFVVQKSATDGFYRSDLATLLKDVDTIVLTGVATDYCVDATARAAVSREFDVVLVEDGHSTAATGDPEAGLTAEQIVRRHNRLLSAMIHPGGTVTVRSSGTIFT